MDAGKRVGGAKEREKLLSFSRAFKFTLPSKWANIEAHLDNFGSAPPFAVNPISIN